MRKDKKKIEELEKELSDAAHKISRLLSIKFDNEDTIKQLRADIAGKDEKYTELLEKYIAMMEKAAQLNEQTVEVTPIKGIKIIVRENEKRLYDENEGATVVVKEVSTVGVKLQYNGELYGDYIVINKPTLEVCEVVEAVNEVFVSLLSALDQPQEGDGNGKQI